MSVTDFLTGTCTIRNRAVVEGMTDTESWTDQSPVSFRVLKRASSMVSQDKISHATMVRVSIMLPSDATLDIADRIYSDGREYVVVEVNNASDNTEVRHKVAICEVATSGTVAIGSETPATPVTPAQVAVENETPVGAVNGVNTVFTIAYAPIDGSVQVYVNGLLQSVTVDYTISSQTITFLVAPETGDIILVSYRR